MGKKVDMGKIVWVRSNINGDEICSSNWKDFFLLIIAASSEGFVDKKRADAKVP